MKEHEKRIREACEEGPYYTAMVAKPDLRALLADLDEARAALTAAKAGGWVAVPVEPTPEMLNAGMTGLFDRKHPRATWEYCIAEMFAAMLAARPLTAPPAQKENT